MMPRISRHVEAAQRMTICASDSGGQLAGAMTQTAHSSAVRGQELLRSGLERRAEGVCLCLDAMRTIG